MSDLKDELRQERREKEWAETWKPDGPGDILIGTLEGYDEATTDFGTYTVAHVRDEEGVLRGLWHMHSVLKDEWDEADPGRGERVSVQYLGQRSGENYDYHMWTVKVDRPEGDSPNEAPQESTGSDTAADRKPQESGRAPSFDGDELYGEPAAETAEHEPASGAGGESTLDDPSGELPF